MDNWSITRPESGQILCVLPFPPSVNTYWRHAVISGKPRVLISEKGRQFRKVVMEVALASQHRPFPGAVTGRLDAALDLYPPTARAYDVDNFSKGLLDALTHAGIYADDAQIKRLRIAMHEKSANPRCELLLCPGWEV